MRVRRRLSCLAYMGPHTQCAAVHASRPLPPAWPLGIRGGPCCMVLQFLVCIWRRRCAESARTNEMALTMHR